MAFGNIMKDLTMYQKGKNKLSTQQALELSKQLGQHVESFGYEYVSGDVLLETYGKHFFIVKDGRFLGNKIKTWENGVIFETTKGLEQFFKQPISGRNFKCHIRWGSEAIGR